MTRPPNILFVVPDHLRPDFLGCYGADFLRTPAIDGLAAQGTRWDVAISPSPICVPARASMLTGQHAHATGVIDNLSWLRPDRVAKGSASVCSRLAVGPLPDVSGVGGVDVPAYADGIALGTDAADRTIVGVTIHGKMARTVNWKLMRNANAAEALYNLRDYPCEQKNIIADHADVRAELDHALTCAFLDGLRAAHAEKRVSEAQPSADHIFHKRKWTRPYPVRQNR